MERFHDRHEAGRVLATALAHYTDRHDVGGRVVCLVDDGLATGATMRVAVAALRRRGPARLVVAVPTAPTGTCRDLEDEADEVVCAVTPEPFMAVGLWYEDFSQTTDEE